jgi:polyisoprenyl-teichoic acid--peptidoglycan teichoic acid transferase
VKGKSGIISEVFMSNSRNSVDGFVPRNRGSAVGAPPSQSTRPPEAKRPQANPGIQADARPRVGINRSEIDDSLKQIDEPERDLKGRVKKTPEQKAKRKKIIKRVLIALFVIILAIGGYIGVKAFIAGSKAFQGNIFDFVQKAPLKMDENGRSNILVVGTSEDNEGGTHPGGNLTDTIMVLSIDQNKKNAFMISMPRDMWVKLDEACDVGYESKINAVYMCSSEDGQNEAAGVAALQKKTGEVFGLDLQYYAHVNTTVVKEAVDAVGGVTVKVESEDPRGIYDPNFDWQCNHQCNMVKYANGQVAQMDGAHALAFARARNAQGGYGLPNGNFDREKNQQKVLRALQEKAISAGTLTNIGKVTSLIDAFGNNLRTNFEVKEIRTLADIGQVVKGDKLQSISLTNEGESVVTTGNVGGQSVVRPLDGLYDYSAIQSYIKKQINSDEVTKEAAEVAVLNGSGVAGAAQVEADKLEAKGLTIGLIDNAPAGDYGKAKIYQIGEGNPATKARLEKIYGVKVTAGDPPILVSETTKFVVVVGTVANSSQPQ